MHPFPSYSSLDHRDPHSFPTRRSSDLPLYKKYLETLPSETQTQAAQTGMKMCTDEAAERDMERDKAAPEPTEPAPTPDRKSTRLNSSHLVISYAVFCLKKKKNTSTVQN